MYIMRKLLPQAGSMNRPRAAKTTHIITPPEWWVMTYQGRVCQIKDTNDYEDDVHRYRRNGWTSRTVAAGAANKMNQLFHTEDFGIRQVQGADRG